MRDLDQARQKHTVSGAGDFTLAIAATFTAEPVEAPLRFWVRELGMSAQIAFAPHNQVFQQLLDPASLLAKNENGVNIVLLRLEDWQSDIAKSKGASDGGFDACSEIERNTRDFIRVVTTAVKDRVTSYLIGLCPISPAASADPEERSFYGLMESLIASQLSEVPGVEVITTAELTEAYPVAEYYDRHADKLGRIPYTSVFYTALGTMIARRAYALKSAPYKLVVLDCDGTLWSGICGEDGSDGIQIDSARKALQEFMVQQHDRGMLICLCSKNNEEDVFEVFDCRNDMILKRDHITAWRINWSPKSENLQSLSRELGLGLDSFILIDDDPMECAKVRERCPEILTLQLPKEPDSIPRFLKHVWAFDHGKITEEDRRRPALYQQHSMREQIRRESLTLKDFLANLNLEVYISPLSQNEIGRASELTLRTSQFNLTTLRRTEAEIRQLCQPGGGAECLAVHVKDRFGDYGLVGVTIFQAHANSLIVDTFLLSCRALGRGVEHAVLSRLGEIAKQRGKGRVDLRCIPSRKNRPALEFLESLGETIKEPFDGGLLFRFKADFAASVSYSGEINGPAHDVAAEEAGLQAPDSTPTAEGRMRTALLRSIPESLYDAEHIQQSVAEAHGRPDVDTPFVAPRTPVEEKIAEIYCELLSVEQVGIHDSFFDLGGHSLLAVQALSRANEAFQVELSPTLLFTSDFTVAELGDEVLKLQLKQTHPQDVAVMLKRLSELTNEEAQTLLGDQRSQSQDRRFK